MSNNSNQTITEFAPAKINLNLHVTGKRNDGYHTMNSLVCFAADIGDTITLSPSDKYRFVINGPFANALNDENIVTKATNFFINHTKTIMRNFEITLTKNLPVAAGIGGGSSDAAATLKALCHYFKKDKTHLEYLTQKSIDLGADVPICMYGNAAIIENIGDIITPLKIPFPECYAVLVNPNEPCSTNTVFKNLTKTEHQANRAQPDHFKNYNVLISHLKDSKNNLRKTAIQNVSVIQSVINELNKIDYCDFVQMSGSGATCFGLFKTYKRALKAGTEIKKAHPEWWVTAPTTLI